MIWKAALPLRELTRVPMPRGSEVLCVQLQNDVPTIWFMADPEEPLADRLIRVRGTGHAFEVGAAGEDGVGEYVGTIQHNGFVWHYFDMGGA